MIMRIPLSERPTVIETTLFLVLVNLLVNYLPIFYNKTGKVLFFFNPHPRTCLLIRERGKEREGEEEKH